MPLVLVKISETFGKTHFFLQYVKKTLLESDCFVWVIQIHEVNHQNTTNVTWSKLPSHFPFIGMNLNIFPVKFSWANS